jgi:uncharacterized protein (TIGR03089 family)
MTPGAARDVPALLAAVQASDPGRPRVTWYGPAEGPGAGERVELSARVLTNWVAKTTNLLVEELDAGPGTRVALDLPPHWKQLVWWLAVRCAGADVVDPDDPQADVLVASRVRPASGGTPHLVLVALPSLARRFEPAPPAGWLDWAAEVAGFGDVLPPLPAPDHAALLGTARERGLPTGARLLVDASPAADAGAAASDLLAALVADGSVVAAGRPLTEGERASELLTG